MRENLVDLTEGHCRPKMTVTFDFVTLFFDPSAPEHGVACRGKDKPLYQVWWP